VIEEQTSGPEVWTNESQTDYKRQLAYEYVGINPQGVKCVPFLRTQLLLVAYPSPRLSRKTTPNDSRAFAEF
jgi:hypothetical protein